MQQAKVGVFEYLNSDNALFMWSNTTFYKEPECSFVFEATTKQATPLVLSSNCAFEVWLNGVFFADGGHRCAVNEALSNYFDIPAATAVQVHFLFCRSFFFRRLGFTG